MPCRDQSSLPSKGESEIVPRKPYSPFQQFDNKADFAMARFDDLINWARKVTCFTTEDRGILFGKETLTINLCFSGLELCKLFYCYQFYRVLCGL